MKLVIYLARFTKKAKGSGFVQKKNKYNSMKDCQYLYFPDYMFVKRTENTLFCQRTFQDCVKFHT